MHPARAAALRALATRENVSPLVQNFLGFLVDQRRLIQFDDRRCVRRARRPGRGC
jgi:hypothetical protein